MFFSIMLWPLNLVQAQEVQATLQEEKVSEQRRDKVGVGLLYNNRYRSAFDRAASEYGVEPDKKSTGLQFSSGRTLFSRGRFSVDFVGRLTMAIENFDLSNTTQTNIKNRDVLLKEFDGDHYHIAANGVFQGNYAVIPKRFNVFIGGGPGIAYDRVSVETEVDNSIDLFYEKKWDYTESSQYLTYSAFVGAQFLLTNNFGPYFYVDYTYSYILSSSSDVELSSYDGPRSAELDKESFGLREEARSAVTFHLGVEYLF